MSMLYVQIGFYAKKVTEAVLSSNKERFLSPKITVIKNLVNLQIDKFQGKYVQIMLTDKERNRF